MKIENYVDQRKILGASGLFFAAGDFGVIDLEKQTQTDHADLMKMGYNEEPEMIDFSDGICYYSDAHGHFYTIAF